MAAQDIEINVVTNGVGSLRDVSVALRSIVLAMTDSSRGAGVLDARQRSLNQALGVTAKGFGNHAKSLREVARNQAVLSKAAQQTTADFRRLRTELALGRGGAGMSTVVRDLGNADKAMRRMRPRALVSDLKGVGRELTRVGKDAQFVGRSLIIGLTTPIVGFASKGLAALVSLERQMVRVRKIVGKAFIESNVTEKEAEGFRKFGFSVTDGATRLDALNGVLKLTSSEFGISRDALAAVTADFAVLGVTATDTLAILTKTAAEVAVLGTMDLDASQELTQTLFLGMQRALDKRGDLFENAAAKQEKALVMLRSQIVLFNAVENATAMSFRDIAAALPEIAAAVGEFGLSFMEGLALTAPIKAAGIQVSVAANAIKMSMQRLTAPTITAKKHMAALENQMQSQIGTSERLAEGFDNLFSVGAGGLQALIDVTEAVSNLESGSAEASAMFSKLFDKRQSTRMKIAVDDLVAFQREMNRSSSGAGKLIAGFNKTIEAQNKMSGSTLDLMDDIESLSTIAKLANVQLQANTGSVKMAGQIFSRADVEAAKAVRAAFQKDFKDKFKDGENLIKTINQESGKVLVTQLLGAGGAVELADAELAVALASIAVTVDRMKIAMKEIGVTLVEDLTPVIEKAAEALMKFRNFIDNMDPAIRKSIVAFLGFAAVIGPLVFIFGQMKLAVGVMMVNILRLVPGLASVSAANIGAASSMLKLRNGLTMQGATIMNTNSRFAMLLATLSDKRGVTGKFANRLGLMTGSLKKTVTASSEVVAATTAVSAAGAKAITSAGAVTAGAAAAASPDLMGIKTSVTKTGRVIGRDAKGRIVSDAIRDQAALAQTSAIHTATPKGFRARTMALLRGKRAARTVRSASGQFVPTAVSDAVVAAEAQKIAPQLAKKRIATDAATGRFAFRGREVGAARAERIAAGGIRGRAAFAATRMAGVGAAVAGSLPGRAMLAPITMPLKGIKAATAGIKSVRANVVSTNAAIQALGAAPGGFAKNAVHRFKIARTAILGMKPAIFSVTGSLKLLRAALIKTGIGAIIIGLTIAVAIFVKNFDAIKTKAQPLLESLSTAFNTLKEAFFMIIAPFRDFFDLLGKGSDNGQGAVNGLGEVFSFLATVVTKAATAIKEFVESKIVPFLRMALGAVLSFADGIKGLVSAFISMFRGGENATEGIIESFKSMVGSVVKLFLGVFVPAIISIIAKSVKIIIDLYVMWLTNMPKILTAVLSLFMQLAAAIVQVIGNSVASLLGSFSFLPGVEGLVNKVTDGIAGAMRRASSGVEDFGKSMSTKIAPAVKAIGNSAAGMVDGLADAAKNGLKKFEPTGIEAQKRLKKAVRDNPVTAVDALDPDFEEDTTNAAGGAGENAAKAFKNKFADEMKSLQQKFVDIVLGIFDSSIKEVSDNLVNALESQRDAALEVFEQQLDVIDKLEKAEESLMRQREHMSARRRMLDERELNSQNFVRNRALAIYEGRIDDARMFDLEERKSRLDSVKQIGDLDEKRNRDLAKENLDFIKDQIKNTKAEADRFFKEQIEAFKEASKQITKFAPGTIEEYETQLAALTDLAKKTATENGDAFAEIFQRMTESIQTELPNIGAGVFTENLQDLVNIAREKYGLDSPSENSIVGATIAMLAGVSSSIQTDGVIINASMEEILQSMKNDVVDKTLDEINLIFEEKNPQKVLAEAIEFANETIRREFEKTVGHVASNVDDLAKSLDPLITKIVEAQLELQALHEKLRNPPTGPGVPPVELIPNLSLLPSGSPVNDPETIRLLRRVSFLGASGSPANDPEMRPELFFSAGGGGRTPGRPPIPNPTPGQLRPGFNPSLIPIRSTVVPNPTQRPNLPLPPRPVVPTSPGGPSITPHPFASIAPGFGLPPIVRRHGGPVPGFGSEGVPALLHGGEFVISSKAVSNIGMAALQSMNQMRFATPGRPGGQQASTQVTETHNYNIMVENFIGEDQWFQSMMKSYNMKVVPRNQKNAGVQSRSISTYSGINRGM